MLSSDGQLACQFLVNSKRCDFSATQDLLSWLPHKLQRNQSDSSNSKGDLKKTNAQLKQIQLAQIIGIKRKVTTSSLLLTKQYETKSVSKSHSSKGTSSPHDRIKIYYVKENHSNSGGQFLKLKTLTIRQCSIGSKQVYSGNNITAISDRTQVQANKKPESVPSSAPPSCYASEGSSNHLSSLSSSSSSSAACSPSPSPVETPSAGVTLNIVSCNNSSNRPGANDASDLSKLYLYLQTQLLKLRKARPKRLLIFVNPYGGKGNALYLYDTKVKRLLDLAEVESTLIVTKYANHARDTIEDPLFKVEHFDGVVCVGGDGMFSELMNGLLFRYNRDMILKNRLAQRHNSLGGKTTSHDEKVSSLNKDGQTDVINSASGREQLGYNKPAGCKLQSEHELSDKQFHSPPVPIGVIGAGSTDANSYGLIGTNDVITAALNIILGHRIKIDACSIHTIDNDDLIKFVSTFVAYGYFGDVIRESEKLRWLGPSRYDITGANNLIKNRTYRGTVRILLSSKDGSPSDPLRCSKNCQTCWSQNINQGGVSDRVDSGRDSLRIIERSGSFVGVNAAVTACRCPQTKKGFSPNNHLANGCADLILVRPCTRLQYIQYMLRTGWTKKSAFDLKYVEAFRCRQFEFISLHQSGKSVLDQNQNSMTIGRQTSTFNSLDSDNSGQMVDQEVNSVAPVKVDTSGDTLSSWNVDGEILNEQSIRVKVNNQLLSVFGTGEPQY